MSDLVVGIHKKTVQRILYEVITNLKGLNIDPRDLLFHQVYEAAQTDWVATAVPCGGGKWGGCGIDEEVCSNHL